MVKQALSPICFSDVQLVLSGNRLLDGLNFSIQDDSLSVILGPNGAGKSLLLKLIHGLILPSAGSITCGNRSAVESRAQQAFVFQRPVLLNRSVCANLSYPLRVRGFPRDEIRLRVREALEFASLSSLTGRAARKLSGGEQQRLSLMRAWVMRPRLLLLDEPTANLDPTSAAQIELLIDTIRKEGTKIVMTTHNLEQAKRLADEVLLLNMGTLAEQAPAEHFFSRPKSQFAKDFLRGGLMP